MKIQMQKWKIHISVDFPQLTLGRWQVSPDLMDAPSGSNRKAHNPDLADMGRVHRPSFVISNHNSMSRLSLSNPPSALIFIVLKVDTGSCLRFVTKWILVQIYGSIFGRAPSMKHKIATKTPAMQFCQWLRWQNRFSRLEDSRNSLQCCFCWWLRWWNRYLGLQDWKRISQGNTLQ